MRILSISAQKPSSTGSGVYLTEIVKELAMMGHEQAVVAGVYKEDDVVDGVLFFGDGTIEFHLANDGDAVNWADFDVDFIKMIIRELKRNQCSKFA